MRHVRTRLTQPGKVQTSANVETGRISRWQKSRRYANDGHNRRRDPQGTGSTNATKARMWITDRTAESTPRSTRDQRSNYVSA